MYEYSFIVQELFINLISKRIKIPFLFISALTALLFSSKASIGQVAPDLGAASSFALFTAFGAFNNFGPTIINGNIGTNAGAFGGFPSGVVNGNIYVENTGSLQAVMAVNEAYDICQASLA